VALQVFFIKVSVLQPSRYDFVIAPQLILFPDKKLYKAFYCAAARRSAFGARKSMDDILGGCAAGPHSAAP